MGIGLGRDSPVKLSLSKDNYNALIERHGQWIRWRIAQKCSCADSQTKQPDIHCKLCGGRGFIYSYQKNEIRFEIVILPDTTGILTISERNNDAALVEVYDYNGNRYPNATKLDNYVYLNAETLPKKGTYFTVILRKDIEKIIEKTEAVKSDCGYYTIPGLLSSKASTDGVYYSAVGDIVGIEKVVDSNGIEYTPTEFRLNQFRILPTTDSEGAEIPIKEPVTVQNVKYIPPFIFAILNQNLSKADAEMVAELRGDAVCTFPYENDVSSDDILTVLAGSYTNKELMIRQDYDFDVLGVYFVYSVISCTGIQNNKTVNYIEGKDFILVENNKIKWLETGNYPDVGENYSIVYRVLPTYKVVKEIPQLRTSENQRFPKKCVIKLFTSYAENIKANKQQIDSAGIDGSY